MEGFAAKLRVELEHGDRAHDATSRIAGLLHAAEEFQGKVLAVMADLPEELTAMAVEISAKL